MKKILLLFLTAVIVVTAAYSQDEESGEEQEQKFSAVQTEVKEPKLTLSGEVKTGVFWKEWSQEGIAPLSDIMLHSKDDAGGEGDQGRFRLNLDYDNGRGFGIRARIQWQNWMENAPQWPYAFGYGNFFRDQLTVAIGKFGGGSPWSTGGPEKWKELETTSGGGMRIEWKPGFIPFGKLNVGFVLNWFDAPMESTGTVYKTLADLLMETVLGASYDCDWFLVRFAFRLDSELDRAIRGTEEYGKEGYKLIYRLEEKMLKKMIGLSIWALGDYEGVGAPDPQFWKFENWLFVQYDADFKKAPDLFTAQVRLGFDYLESRSILHFKPSIYFNILNKLISIGASFLYGQDFGDGKMFVGSPYLYFEIEPKLQINFSNSYIAFVYNFRREYLKPYAEARGADPIKQTQWMNLRFCIYY